MNAVKRAYSVAEAATYLSSSQAIIRGLIRGNKLPAKKLGTKVLIDGADLDALFEALPEVD